MFFFNSKAVVVGQLYTYRYFKKNTATLYGAYRSDECAATRALHGEFSAPLYSYNTQDSHNARRACCSRTSYVLVVRFDSFSCKPRTSFSCIPYNALKLPVVINKLSK